MVRQDVVHLGVLSNRHPMPVHEYLWNQALKPGQSAYDIIYQAARSWAARQKNPLHVALYYTGLTEATLAALDGLSSNPNLNVTPMRYDTQNQSYEPITRHVAKRRKRR